MAGFWVGTEDGGLNRFIQNEEIFQQIYHDPADSRSVSNNTAWEIIETKEHSLWVGTMNAGLNRWPANYRKQGIPLFDRFTKSDGLTGSTIYGILEDESGDIWLSSNRGLSQLNPGSRDVRHFDRHNGIRGDEFNHGARLKTRSGLLVFGGMQGLVVFDPAKVLHNKHRPKIIVSATTNSQATVTNYSGQETLGSINPDYADRFVDFKFAALDYASPGKNQYLYKLTGFNVGHLTGSIGFANYPFNSYHPRRFTWKQVVGIADQAAYIAKKNGKNSWVGLYGAEITDDADVASMKPNLSNVIKAGHAQMVTSICGDIEYDFIVAETVLASD